MKKVLFAIVSVFTMAAYASGGNAPVPFVCYFNVPNVHPMQDDGPYTGRGDTPTQAKNNALKSCHEDLDFWAPSACDSFYQDSSKMECTINVR